MGADCDKKGGKEQGSRKTVDYALKFSLQNTGRHESSKLYMGNDMYLNTRLSIEKGGRIRLSGYVLLRSYIFAVGSSGPNSVKRQRWQVERKVIYPMDFLCVPKSI